MKSGRPGNGTRHTLQEAVLVTDAGKGREQAFDAIILIVIDLMMLESAFLATYWFRFFSGFWLVPLGVPPLGMYLASSVMILLVFL